MCQGSYTMSKRLIAFGCSITYGQGLPDCNTTFLTPSNYAWPSLVAKNINCTCNNQARPGSSNREILWRILNYNEYHHSDIVVILWTIKDRSSIITGKNFWDIIQLHIQEWSGQPKEVQIWRKFKVKTYNQYDTQLETLHYIDYAHRVLKEKVKTVLHYVSDDDLLIHTEPYIEAKLLGNGKKYMLRYPYAADGGHPGEEGHRAFADKINKDLNKELTCA